MGCDIHIYVEKKNNDKWERVPDSFGPPHPYYEINTGDNRYPNNIWKLARNYTLFGALAGVRNREIKPISNPKGIPADCSQSVKEEYLLWGDDAHTPSYLFLKEILDSKNHEYSYPVYVDPLNYKKYMDGFNVSEIDTATTYDGSEWKKLISNQEMDRLIKLSSFLNQHKYITQVKISYKYSEINEHFWNHFVPAMEKLGGDPSDVRVVFWFDN